MLAWRPNHPSNYWSGLPHKLRLVANANTVWFTEEEGSISACYYAWFRIYFHIGGTRKPLCFHTTALRIERKSCLRPLTKNIMGLNFLGEALLGIQGSFVAVHNLKRSTTLWHYAVGRRDSTNSIKFDQAAAFSTRSGRAFSPSTKKSFLWVTCSTAYVTSANLWFVFWNFLDLQILNKSN